jgi:hypothetical protein
VSEAYYVTPVESVAQVYYMTPVESVKDAYYIVPVGVEEAWTFIRTVYIDSQDWATLAQVPGNYDGYVDHITLQSYNQVQVVGHSGAWNDGGAAPNWRGFCTVVTQVDYDIVGYFDSFDTESEAKAAFKGAFAELTLGDDKTLHWGIDDIAGSNSGILAIEIYAK